MKRLVGFCIFVIVLIGLFLYFSLRTKDYDTEYVNNGMNILEKYVKDEENYYFKLSKDNFNYDFVIHHKYSNKRKIVNQIIEQDKDGYKCVSIKVFDYTTPYVCSNGDEYVDGYSLKGGSDGESSEPIKTVNKIDVYNEDYDYYIWNGYGITNILNGEKYNFLKRESYDNNLSYQYGKYLIFSDYDQTREFNKFYIFNHEDKKITEWEFEDKISFNSYFMGDEDDSIYLFDKKNKIQYKLNIEKQIITKTSDNEAAMYYKDKWDVIGLNKLVYSNIYFEKTNLINYSIKDDKVYYHYKNSNNKILFDSDEKIGYVDIKESDAFYLKKDTLYRYNVNNGKTKLLSYFEWNFSFNNKIFIFD